MRSILVLNAKGGSGKSTIAMNLAAFMAVRGAAVTLVDFDPQQSSMDWLEVRPEGRPPIHGVDGWGHRVRIPAETEYLVMDAPAALHGQGLSQLVKRAETIVVPVLPSPLDLRAALRFHDELTRVARVHNKDAIVGLLANRVRELSPSRLDLEDFLRSLRLNGRRMPLVGVLRNSQNYVRAAARGLGICEIAPSAVEHDLELWRPLLRWINSPRSQPT